MGDVAFGIMDHVAEPGSLAGARRLDDDGPRRAVARRQMALQGRAKALTRFFFTGGESKHRRCK